MCSSCADQARLVNVKKYFNLPVLSRLSLNESIRTGNSTPRAKENPSVRIMQIVEPKQMNHDQRLSCLKEETSPQKRPMIAMPRLYCTKTASQRGFSFLKRKKLITMRFIDHVSPVSPYLHFLHAIKNVTQDDKVTKYSVYRIWDKKTEYDAK